VVAFQEGLQYQTRLAGREGVVVAAAHMQNLEDLEEVVVAAHIQNLQSLAAAEAVGEVGMPSCVLSQGALLDLRQA
jgi:hypothetical protein